MVPASRRCVHCQRSDRTSTAIIRGGMVPTHDHNGDIDQCKIFSISEDTRPGQMYSTCARVFKESVKGNRNIRGLYLIRQR